MEKEYIESVISLTSVGTAIGVNSLICYPLLQDGTAQRDAPTELNDSSNEWWEALSNSDKKLIEFLKGRNPSKAYLRAKVKKMDYVNYGNTGTGAYFDGKDYFNAFGQKLRNPNEYNKNVEGYTPFGDE